MGDFDFGQFQQIYQYLIEKVQEGGQLTPEEQKVYDMLIGFANQGLNLTNTADFNSLYTAFNGLADEATKRDFESQYGTGLLQNPDGTISFTRPGSVMEAFMRRGLSVNDGPAMAALSEGLRNYNTQLAQNKFNSMTNAYQDMTPIRAQNIQAATNAGNLGSTAAQRRVGLAGVASSGARGGAGGGGEEGGGEPINVPVPPRPEQPSILERLAPDLFKLLASGGIAAGGFLLKDWYQNRGKGDKLPQDELDAATRDIVRQGSQGVTDQSTNPIGQLGDRSENVYLNTAYNPYQVDQQAFQGYPLVPDKPAYDVGWQGPQYQPQYYSNGPTDWSSYNNYSGWGGSSQGDYYDPNYYDYSGSQSPGDQYWGGDTGSQDIAWGGASDWSLPDYGDYTATPNYDWGY